MTDEPFPHALPNLSPRHVPRPRLTRLLDDTRAQTLILDAPAGYGKTSLAVEWLRGRNDVAWFTARPDSGDVGAAVLGVALAASRLLPQAADRVRQRLSIVEEPAQAAVTFAEILAEDLADWPSGGIIAIDDYHHLAESDAAESFIDWLLALRGSLRLLVATRRRPTWASARRVLAGDVLELDKRVLSMTDEEVTAVLGGDTQPEVRDLVAKAEGWPAVIGLAALSPTPDLDAAPRIADDLFRYFAEEVLRSMSPEERRLVLLTSVPRSLTPGLVRDLVGESEVSRLEELRRLGLLTEDADGELRFHPLVREFLLKQLRRDDQSQLHEIAHQLLDRARTEERWEDAFDASLMLDDARGSADVAGDAAEDLIRAGRIETLERWLAACGEAADESVGATLASATLLYHAGRFASSRSLALDAEKLSSARDVPSARAVNLAARAAFALGRSQDALEQFLRARAHAATTRDRVDALSGAVMATAELEDPRAIQFGEELDREAPADRENRVRSFTRWTAIDDRLGTLEKAERMLRAIEPVQIGGIDPLVHSAALNAKVHVLCGQALFVDALEVVHEGCDLCERFHLPWARDWIELTGVRALLGLGRVAESRSLLARLESAAERTEDTAFRFVYARSRIQLELAEASTPQADYEPPPAIEPVAAAPVAELRAFAALRAAFGGDQQAAKRLAREAATMSGAVEPVCYSGLAIALADDLEEGDLSPSAALQNAVANAIARRLVEAVLVVARRHEPLATWGATRPVLAEALGRARLVATASGLGEPECIADLAARGLTPRELEVLALLAQGRTNAEIARALVVSLATAKTHVSRILGKLEVRNRAEATRLYLAIDGSGTQAADASASSSSG